MKAEKTRKLLDELNCQACGYAKEILEKGFCFHSCEDHYRLEDEINSELTELERLAEIGKAVEAATFELRPWIIGHNRGPYLYPSNEEIQELISWHRGE